MASTLELIHDNSGQEAMVSGRSTVDIQLSSILAELYTYRYFVPVGSLELTTINKLIVRLKSPDAFVPSDAEIVVLTHVSEKALLRQNPRVTRIVEKCELVTEGNAVVVRASLRLKLQHRSALGN